MAISSMEWLEQAAQAFEPHHPDLPATPLDQATELDPAFRIRPHLTYLSDQLTQAVHDVEQGHSRQLAVMMPPRMGKTTLATIYTPLWILRQHPGWPIALTSHDGRLATSWGRQIRRYIEQHPTLGVRIAKDAGAASEWETTTGGKVLSISVRESFTGRGAKCLVLDDVHKDFVDAHSATSRQTVWDWYRTVAKLRLEPPSLTVAIMTRWHQDDMIGRLLSREHEGDPDDWEVIRFPALAEEADVLGRVPGAPLLSPLIDETPDEAITRWEKIRTDIGSYAWASLMQQRPAPAKGAIFDTSWWRFWTRDPDRVEEGDDTVVLLNPEADLTGARWLDSWDCAFKGTDASDYVVGQRWARKDANRYLIAQQRGRWSFTQTLTRMRDWANGAGPHGQHVHERLVEDKANGTAVIDVLKREIAGMIPVNPTNSKEARARAVTPEIEAGNVYLPHPSDPGNEWVNDALAELREFNHGAHDDVVDALTQALSRLRDAGRGQVTIPGAGNGAVVRRDYAAASRTSPRRTGSNGAATGPRTPAGRVRIPGR